jgi:MFS family permease
MVSTDVTAFQLSPAEHQVQLRRAVIASTIGTAIEWYDFFLYSTVTGLVFAKLFFPNSDPWVGTLEAFAIYAVGFVARPVGAAMAGAISSARRISDVVTSRPSVRAVV